MLEKMTPEQMDQLALEVWEDCFGAPPHYPQDAVNFARRYRAALAEKTTVGAFRHLETGEIRYTLDNRHDEDEWEDVYVCRMEDWKK